MSALSPARRRARAEVPAPATAAAAEIKALRAQVTLLAQVIVKVASVRAHAPHYSLAELFRQYGLTQDDAEAVQAILDGPQT